MTVELPTPADVPTGHVIEVVLRGHRYTSAVMAPAIAAAERARLLEQVKNIGPAFGLLEFVTHSGHEVAIRAREIVDVVTGPPRTRHERPRQEVVHVHVHLGPPADEATRAELETAAETAPISLVPTPAAMARFPRPPL